MDNACIPYRSNSPDLYNFTKKVIAKYGCILHEDSDNVYAQAAVKEDLTIKTHYESLDIAGSNRVHYLCFSLPAQIPGKELDAQLQEELKNEAAAD